MNWNSIAGVASTMALFLPVLLIIYFRQYKNGSLLTLALYYLFGGLYNLMTQGLLPVFPQTKQITGALINYLDAPMMLTVVLFFCAEKWQRRAVLLTLYVFIGYALVVLLFHGFRFESSTYILGPGILIMLVYSIYFFVRFGKLSIVHGKSMGLTIMLFGVLFSYGCFAIIYVLHYILKTPAVNDVFLLYYIVTFISSVLVATGLVWISKRSRQLKEVQTTRKELALFFSH